MGDVYCYAYVEDVPSQAVVKKLVKIRNAQTNHDHQLLFHGGFPTVTRGFGKIKNKCETFFKMALAGLHILVLTDLDNAECACTLIRDWFGIPEETPVNLPSQCIFRVAVKEVESWIIADHAAWAQYIGIAKTNFSKFPDQLDDPKQDLLNVIRKKGRKRVHREMLPKGAAHIGPMYNEVLCEFVETIWEPERAAKNSPSLARAFKAIMNV